MSNESTIDPLLISVLGGGQLGMMLAEAGAPLGMHFRFLDPSPQAPAAPFGELIVGTLGDTNALLRTARGSAVVTYEWEGVPATGAASLESAGHLVRPSIRALEVSQDRLSEKNLFRSLSIGVAEFAAVDDRSGLDNAVDAIGLPAVLKTRCGGYDGKGQVVLQDRADVGPAWEALGKAGPLILEAWVPFDRELSIIAVRSTDGDTLCWPLVTNEHRDGILRTSTVTAEGDNTTLRASAEKYVGHLLDELDYVGVLALELFDVGGQLLANEMAPRVHNSGHWTIEGASTSQFENHLRAIAGWPLGPTALKMPSVMVNCIGSLPEAEAVGAITGAHLHVYGKSLRPGRKVGHVTVVAPDTAQLHERLTALREVLPPDIG